MQISVGLITSLEHIYLHNRNTLLESVITVLMELRLIASEKSPWNYVRKRHKKPLWTEFRVFLLSPPSQHYIITYTLISVLSTELGQYWCYF